MTNTTLSRCLPAAPHSPLACLLAAGTNVMLGPGLNLQRVPWGGRTFEYMSGEASDGRRS